MRRVASRIGVGAVLLAALAIALLSGPAGAHQKIQELGNGNFNSEMSWELPCGSENKGSSNYNQVPPGLPGITETHGLPPDPRVIISAIKVNGVMYHAEYGLGGGCAGESGGPMVAIAPDTLYASVGLYPPGGGKPDTSRMMHFSTIRTAGNVRLVYLGGGLQTGPVGAGQVANVSFTVLVHPNQAAANADKNNTGVGANFFGKVTLTGGTGVLTTTGGFSNSDFTVTNDGNGKFTALFVPGFTKDVAITGPGIASEVDAVVSMVGDPKTDIPPPPLVPGQTPIGLVLLTLALMVAGFSIIRSRRSVTIA